MSYFYLRLAGCPPSVKAAFMIFRELEAGDESFNYVKRCNIRPPCAPQSFTIRDHADEKNLSLEF